MPRALIILLLSWTAAAHAAAPSELFNLAYTLDPQSRAVMPPLGTRLPKRLEELLLAPEIALPAAPAVSVPVSKTAPRKDLWDRIRDGFGVPDLDAPLVDRWQAWYLARPLMLKAILERSRRYLYHVVEELSKRGMPLELALLPMVESGYDPTAVSSAQAAGMWQFIPSTGRDYGLHRGVDYDARRDIVASTAAALDYLQFLHELFGDWHLALAGYNWGENAVLKAIERNKGKVRGTDYLSLTLPEETRNYLPKFQALKNLVAYHHAFGLELDPIPNEPYFTTVATDHSLDLVVAARLSGAPLEEITSLNPARSGATGGTGATRASGGPGTTRGLVLPADKADKFLANFENYKNATPAKKPAKRRPVK